MGLAVCDLAMSEECSPVEEMKRAQVLYTERYNGLKTCMVSGNVMVGAPFYNTYSIME